MTAFAQASKPAKTTPHRETLSAKVRSYSPDAASSATFWQRVAEELRWPWRFLSIDFSRKDGPVAQHDRFEALKAFAASGHAGCKIARKHLKTATNRGLAAAIGRPLPEVLAR